MTASSSSDAALDRVSSWPMWVLGLVIMIDQADQNVVRGVATPIQHAFHLTDLQVGVLLSCFIVVNGFVTVPAGYLADRWHRTRTVGHTVVIWSAITSLTAAAWSYPVLIGIRSALGFGQAVTEPSAASLLADHYPVAQRGRAFSVQQCLLFVGFGAGLGVGGVVGAALGWRAAFLVVSVPGVLIALAVYRLPEPRRGHGDRLQLGVDDAEDTGTGGTGAPGLFAEGVPRFLRDLVRGLVADLGTIARIPTMRYALVGVSAVLFTVVAVAAALPQFYERQLHVATGTAELLVGAMVILGGIPGVLLGGPLADRYAPRVRGGRMAIPALCLIVGESIFVLSYLWLPLGPAFGLQVVGLLVIALAVPSLRAGLSDAVPANLRGAGFGAFNLVSVVGGQAAASVIVFALAGVLGGNFRTALLLVSIPVFGGALVFLRARDHFDRDAAKILEAVARALQEQQAGPGLTGRP
ncbi:MAG TPA: MFS transporter [Acidimicrobiales bacterium]|nr:MFS transporter [Acidimicrobiales bacterium]